EYDYGPRHIYVAAIEVPAPDGLFAARVDSTEWIESQFLRVRPGLPLTLSAWMRAENEPLSVSLQLHDGSQIQYTKRASIGTSCDLTTEWKRFSVTGRLPAGANNAAFVRVWGSKAPFFLDAVQVEEGDLSPFSFPSDLEIGLTRLDTLTGIYPPASTPSVRLDLRGRPGASVSVATVLEDYYGRVRLAVDTDLILDPSGSALHDLDIPLPAPGIYRLVSSSPAAASPAEVLLAQVLRSPAPYGGIHASVTRLSLDFVSDSGFAWWRLHDHNNPFSWPHLEPERGRFAWDDDAVNRRLSTGARILACLYNAPEWARKRVAENPGAPTVTADYDGVFLLDDWKEYVRQASRHFKDRIHHWEIWNEPSGLAPAEYMKLLKEGYTVIKEEDPDAFVVGGGGLHSYAAPYVETLFSLGALDFMDAYSFHGYLLDGGDPWQFGTGLRELMRKHGKVVPFWDTEWGQQCNSFKRTSFFGGQSTYRWPTYPYRTAVNLLLRHELAERALGVQANFWYTLGPYEPSRNESGGLLTLVEYDGSPRATVPSLANTWDLLGPAELIEKLEPSPLVRVYAFSRPDGVLVAIDTKLVQGLSATVSLPLDRPALRVNPMGERAPVERGGGLVLMINDERLLLFFPGAGPDEVLPAVRALAFDNLPPPALVSLLAIDHTNRAPALLEGAQFLKEVDIGFDLAGWLLDKSGNKLLVFASLAPAGAQIPVPVSESQTTIYDSLGNPLPLTDGRVIIDCRAPYVAVGGDLANAIGTRPLDSAPNLLKNPSFEEGDCGVTPAAWSPWDRFSGESTFVREKGGRTPKSSGLAVLVQSPKDDFVYASQGANLPLQGGGRYGFSVWLRAARPVRADVYLEIRGGDGKGLVENRSRYNVTTEWARYAAAVTIPKGKGTANGAFRAIVQLFETPNTRLEIDDADLRYLGPSFP
ncbi:MAG: hypothetical protein V2A58_17190, partial [Planctomycetota bacterium]